MVKLNELKDFMRLESLIVFIQMVIWPARLAERYITVDERRHILSEVNSLVQNDQWSDALIKVIGKKIFKKFNMEIILVFYRALIRNDYQFYH